MDLDPDVIEKLGALLAAVKGIPEVKIRTLKVDIGPWYHRHRVRIVGERSMSGRAVKITSIEKLP